MVEAVAYFAAFAVVMMLVEIIAFWIIVALN